MPFGHGAIAQENTVILGDDTADALEDGPRIKPVRTDSPQGIRLPPLSGSEGELEDALQGYAKNRTD